MQAFVDRVFENKFFLFVASVLVLLAILALLLFIFRLTFGRRLKTPGGGRTRLPRLGIVDAFNLDRNRQLVIVRRDNVEHLVMIGGPNDLVIETEIIRAEGREVRLRDKEAREKEPREASHAPVPAPAPGAPAWQPEFDPAAARIVAASQQYPRKAPGPPIAPALELNAPPPDALIAEPVAPPPAPRTPAFPSPPRRVAPSPAASQRPPREPLVRPDFLSRIETGAAPSGAFPRAPLATPFLRPSQARQPEEPGPKLPPAAANPAGFPPAAGASSAEESAPPAIVAAASGAAPDGGNALAQGLSLSHPAATWTDGAAPFEAASAPLHAPADKLANDLRRPAPASDELALADPSPAEPADSLDDSLEQEMARLLGRGA